MRYQIGFQDLINFSKLLTRQKLSLLLPKITFAFKNRRNNLGFLVHCCKFLNVLSLNTKSDRSNIYFYLIIKLWKK